MNRIFVVAQTEFLALVRRKAFLVGILMMPALMVAFITFMNYAEQYVDTEDRAIAVIDHTGVLYGPLARAAETRNSEAAKDAGRTPGKYLLSRVDPGGRDADAIAADLSDRVRRKELFAFVDLPAGLVKPSSKDSVRFYAQTTSARGVTNWIEREVNEEIARQRFASVGLDPAVAEQLMTHADVTPFGLVERAANGTVAPAKEVDELSKIALPMFILVLMFLAVMTGAMHLLNAIIEEKMSKISEVLLGSVTPMQLLAGKLLGVVAVSLLLTLVYFLGGIYTLVSLGRADLINPVLIGWFLVFMVSAALMYGSVFLSIGSACSDLKESQSMAQPAMMLVLLAYLGSFVVMRAPESKLAVALSFVPTMTPFTMMLRLTMPPGPPLWQVLVAVAMLMGTTMAILWAAGRIFRIGLLMQGKPPTLPELIKWVRL
jgi:ABC-2 type transport system permease protein